MTKKLYGSDLKDQLIKDRQRILDTMAERNSRINQGVTDYDDCFMSIKVEQGRLSEIDMQLKILASDGLRNEEALFDENGNEVSMRWVSTKYGTRIVANGIFASSVKALIKKTGFELKTIRVPCWTRFVTSGSGLCGVYSGSYIMDRWHTNMVTGEYVGYPD